MGQPIGGNLYHCDQSLEQEPKVALKTCKMVAAGWATQPRGMPCMDGSSPCVLRGSARLGRGTAGDELSGASSHGSLGQVSRK